MWSAESLKYFVDYSTDWGKRRIDTCIFLVLNSGMSSIWVYEISARKNARHIYKCFKLGVQMYEFTHRWIQKIAWFLYYLWTCSSLQSLADINDEGDHYNRFWDCFRAWIQNGRLVVSQYFFLFTCGVHSNLILLYKNRICCS